MEAHGFEIPDVTKDLHQAQMTSAPASHPAAECLILSVRKKS